MSTRPGRHDRPSPAFLTWGARSRAYRQERLREILQAADGALVPVPSLLVQLYGSADPDAFQAFRNVLHRLRAMRPDLEIEHVGGYRLRRAGERRDREARS